MFNMQLNFDSGRGGNRARKWCASVLDLLESQKYMQTYFRKLDPMIIILIDILCLGMDGSVIQFEPPQFFLFSDPSTGAC